MSHHHPSALPHRLWKSLHRRKTIAEVAETASGPNTKGQLKRALGCLDVMAYGVSSTLGAGLFVVTGRAAHDFAGPAVCMSYMLAGAASLVSALCYAEFATQIPVSGSAYSFVYVALGEGAAWLIGWNLVLEYGVSASAVARGWADYLANFCRHCGAPLPGWLHGLELEVVPSWSVSVSVSPLAAGIVLACTAVLLLGVAESARLNLTITVLNLVLIAFVITAGAGRVEPANWVPWAPNGVGGIVAGSAYVFFSYIGFDSVCTLAEEVRNPRRDLPIGIIGSLAIVTALYVAASAVLTGMVPSSSLDLRAPMSEAFAATGMPWAATVVSLGSVSALTGTALCSLFGQPRIFFRMAQDGLIPAAFGAVHAKTQVPVFATVVTGVAAALLALLLDGDILMDLISIGTLMAFCVVCIALVTHRLDVTGHHQHHHDEDHQGPATEEEGRHVSRFPRALPGGDDDGDAATVDSHQSRGGRAGAWVRSRGSASAWIWAFSASCALLNIGAARGWGGAFLAVSGICTAACVAALSAFPQRDASSAVVITRRGHGLHHQQHQHQHQAALEGLPGAGEQLQPSDEAVNISSGGGGTFQCPWVPLVPCLGAAMNMHLMAGLPPASGARLVVWSAAGLAIYLGYGVWHSRAGSIGDKSG